MSEHDPQPGIAGAIDDNQPWLGLDSFSEQTRAYFYGRDDEIGELARRVQRKTLTILFGQSGLGKTSILRAGLVPRLRPEGYCPVYVRISYGDDAPAPAEQIKQAILRAAEAQGSWTRAGAARPGESLWEFLHHRDDVLLDAVGRPLIPLLIFDQFEEVFTIGQTDDAGKRRAAQFLAELADLAENRPPQALEERIDADDALAESFDFARDDYRILISLREDYLAHLEGLRSAMPSVTQNRMRLARMTGAQALSAVVKPGGRLVNEEVAAAIVRFIAGGAELANAEVEPSLLSLICRELNNHRIAQGRAEISTDLLAGSHAGILGEFYQRALRDMPDGVHVLIEDQLLTEAGYRENLAEERVLAAFAAAGAPAGALATLVNGRLLRIEERLDVRRVELTHDVLCGVVKAAREQRHERQAKEAAQAQLLTQQQEQQRMRRELVRARQWLVGGVSLAVMAASASWYGYVSTERAVQTRSGAEKLVGYLLEDYAWKLQPVGRLDLVGELSRRALAYYDGLPAALRNADTDHGRAMAMVRLGHVRTYQGNVTEAAALLDEALAVLRKAYDRGDRTARTRSGLSQALFRRAAVDWSRQDLGAGLKLTTEAVAIMRALVNEGNASPEARNLFSLALAKQAYAQLVCGLHEQAIQTAREGQAVASAVVPFDIGSAAMGMYLEASSVLISALSAEGRWDEFQAELPRIQQMTEQKLERWPDHFQTLEVKSYILFEVAKMELGRHRVDAALRAAQSNLEVSEQLQRIDRRSANQWENVSHAHLQVSVLHWRGGRVQSTLDELRRAIERDGGSKPWLSQRLYMAGLAEEIYTISSETGDTRGAQAAMQQGLGYLEQAGAANPGAVAGGDRQRLALSIAALRYGGAPQDDAALAALIARAERHAADKSDPSLAPVDAANLHMAWQADAEMALQSGQYERAAASAAKLAQLPVAADMQPYVRQDGWRILQALALAHLHRDAEAQALMAPDIAALRTILAAGSDDQYVRFDLARSLLSSALSSPARRGAELREALALLNGLPAEMRALRTVKLWENRVREAMQS